MSAPTHSPPLPALSQLFYYQRFGVEIRNVIDQALTFKKIKELCNHLESSLKDVVWVLPEKQQKEFVDNIAVKLMRKKSNFTLDDVKQAVGNEIVISLTTGVKWKPGHANFFPEKKKTSVVIFIGDKGSGLTTTCIKYARYHEKKGGFRPALICAHKSDVHGQMCNMAADAKIPYYGSSTESEPEKVAAEGVEKFKEDNYNLIIVESHEGDLEKVVERTKAHHVIKVLDSRTTSADTLGKGKFEEEYEDRAAIVTMLDRDENGVDVLLRVGNAGYRIIFIGTGESMDAFEMFDAASFVKRLLDKQVQQNILPSPKKSKKKRPKHLNSSLQIPEKPVDVDLTKEEFNQQTSPLNDDKTLDLAEKCKEESSQQTLQLNEDDVEDYIEAIVLYRMNGDSGHGRYKNDCLKMERKLWAVKVADTDYETLRAYRELSHANLLSYRFDHPCKHKNGWINVCFEPFDSTLVDYIRDQDEKLLMNYELVAGEGVERHICTYVPPKYRKLLGDMMSFFCHMVRAGFMIEKVSLDNLGVKEKVLQFHDLIFVKNSPVKHKKNKSGQYEPLSKLIKALFSEFGFEEVEKWPADLSDFVTRLRLMEFDPNENVLYMDKHLTLLSPSERISFIGNLRDRRWLVDDSIYHQCIQGLEVDNWTERFKPLDGKTNQELEELEKKDTFGVLKRCFRYPTSTYINNAASFLQFCRSLSHHLYKYFHEFQAGKFSSLDVDATLMAVFGNEIIKMQIVLGVCGALEAFML